MTIPDGGMYGIKIVGPDHLAYPMFTDEFDGHDGRQTLMNFDVTKRDEVAAIPVGHQCFVYVAGWQRFIWAVEFTGTLEDGDKAWAAHGYAPGTTPPGIPSKWALYRPIRFVARMDPPISGPTRFEVYERWNYLFEPEKGRGHYYLPLIVYERLFDLFPWSDRPAWVCGGKFDPPGFPRVALTQELLDSYGEQLRKGRAEFGISTFMRALGYDDPQLLEDGDDFLVSFWWVGSDVDRVVTCETWNAALADINIDHMRRLRAFGWATETVVDDMRRLRAFGHAMQAGARFVVITDGDGFEVHDRTKGLDYESTLCGSFRLSKSTVGAIDLLNLMKFRP